MRVVSSDDGVNAAGGTSGAGGGESVGDYVVSVTGGTLVIDAEGDGLDSNGTASISGGTVVVSGPSAPRNGALDVNGTFEVSGGTLTATGSAGMAVSPSAESTQGWMSATLSAAVDAGTELRIVDADGTLVATYVTTKDTQHLVYSAAAITDGEEYQVVVAGESVATVTAGEAAAGGTGGRMGGPRSGG